MMALFTKMSVVKRVQIAFAILFAALLPAGIVDCSPVLCTQFLRTQSLRTLAPSSASACVDDVAIAPNDEFSFAVTSDMRYFSGPRTYDSSDYFRGALQALAAVGTSSFLVVAGDMDPVSDVQWTIEEVLGAHTWYPVVGNHELPGAGRESSYGANLAALQTFDYGAVNTGPSGCPTTTYSFDYRNVHFVALNEYCSQNGPSNVAGQVSDHVYDWLVADLDATDQPVIIIFGHEPGYPQPDAESGRMRHLGESLDEYPVLRDRFWELMARRGVTAYICGHTHNTSAVRIGGVWQIDSGHSRGTGDLGARSTFVVVNVGSRTVTFDIYRLDWDTEVYILTDSGVLVGESIYLPLVSHTGG